MSVCVCGCSIPSGDITGSAVEEYNERKTHKTRILTVPISWGSAPRIIIKKRGIWNKFKPIHLSLSLSTHYAALVCLLLCCYWDYNPLSLCLSLPFFFTSWGIEDVLSVSYRSSLSKGTTWSPGQLLDGLSHVTNVCLKIKKNKSYRLYI